MADNLPEPAALVPEESAAYAARLGVELAGRMLLDATDAARRRRGPTVVTPSDVLAAYDKNYRSQSGGGTVFTLALFFLGLSGGALFTLYGLQDTAQNPLAVYVAYAVLGVGFVLQGVAADRNFRSR